MIGWITNCFEQDKEGILADLLDVPGRVIQVGRPKATERYSADELIKMDVVGLYDVDPSMADQCRGFADIRISTRRMV